MANKSTIIRKFNKIMTGELEPEDLNKLDDDFDDWISDMKEEGMFPKKKKRRKK